jgi:hypothetical protein
MNALNVRSRVIKDALSCEIIESRLLGLEFETDYWERLSIDQTNRREGSECLCAVLQDFVVHRSVTCVNYLDSLINWFVHSSRRESNLVWRCKLNHGNERLGSRWEGVSNKSDIHAGRRVELLIQGFLKLSLLDSAEKSLASRFGSSLALKTSSLVHCCHTLIFAGACSID